MQQPPPSASPQQRAATPAATAAPPSVAPHYPHQQHPPPHHQQQPQYQATYHAPPQTQYQQRYHNAYPQQASSSPSLPKHDFVYSANFTVKPHLSKITTPAPAGGGAAANKRRARAAAGQPSLNHQKKPKWTDLQLPAKLVTAVPEAEIYRQLLELERKLDATLQGKHMDYNEMQQPRSQRVTKQLRMFIYNTYENQTAQYHTEPSCEVALEEPPSWTLRIEGYLLDEQQQAGSYTQRYPAASQRHNQATKKFSHFFHKVVIQLNQDDSQQSIVEWTKSQSVGDTDGFEVKRQGCGDQKVKIFLHLDYNPSRFKLSSTLASVLHMHTDTRPKIILRLWQYIKENGLQDPDDRRQFISDEALQQVFHVKKIQFSEIPQLLSEHLGPPDPIELDYTIRCTGNPAELKECYDVQVEADEQLVEGTALYPPSYSKELDALEDQIRQTIQTIRKHDKRREFMHALSESPLPFLNKLVVSQVHDYELLHGDGTSNTTAKTPFSASEEEERHASYFYQPYTLAAVRNYVAANQDNPP
ncbi:SWI/SNF and RSC complex subunit Ssr3, variant 2 [Balamuthia mandrillaris]